MFPLRLTDLLGDDRRVDRWPSPCHIIRSDREDVRPPGNGVVDGERRLRRRLNDRRRRPRGGGGGGAVANASDGVAKGVDGQAEDEVDRRRPREANGRRLRLSERHQ